MIGAHRKRSIVKSILWRIIGIVFLATITFAFTGNLIETSLITILHHGVFIIVYYLHDRLWQNIKITGYKRYIARMLIYEIVLGQGILAIISFLITGSLQQMTEITFAYIWNKLWIYIVYDWLWSKTKWGINK